MNVLKDQLESVDTIWFPRFAEYNERFLAQMKAHEQIRNMVAEIEPLLEPESFLKNATSISEKFQALHERVNWEYDTEERLSNELGHCVPMGEIRALEKKQDQRRAAMVKIYGHLWSAVYLLRALSPKERAIFPPGIPNVVMGGMLTAGGIQFKRYANLFPPFYWSDAEYCLGNYSSLLNSRRSAHDSFVTAGFCGCGVVFVLGFDSVIFTVLKETGVI